MSKKKINKKNKLSKDDLTNNENELPESDTETSLENNSSDDELTESESSENELPDSESSNDEEEEELSESSDDESTDSESSEDELPESDNSDNEEENKKIDDKSSKDEDESSEDEDESGEDKNESDEDKEESDEDKNESDEDKEESDEDDDMKEKINKMVNFKKSKIEPIEWVRPNKLIFPHWIGETFSDKYTLSKESEKITPGKFKPFKYQKFLKRYMNPESPYRGVLLYHGLGSGKTCTAINIADQFKEKKNIIVLLPASLKYNFEKKGLKFCGSKDYRNHDDKYKDYYTFVSYNASNTPEQIKRVGSLDNKVIIIEEAHNLISMMVGGILDKNKNGRFIYNSLLEAKNTRIIALTGTPIQKDQYELGLILNVLRGYIEITRFNIISKSGNNTELKSILQKLPYIDYIDFNLINNYIELHLTIKSYDENYFGLTKDIEKLCRDNGVEIKYSGFDNLLLFPEEPEDFDKMYIEEKKSGDTIKDKSILEKRMMGLISFYELNKKYNPEILKDELVYVNMSNYQNIYYDKLREKEKKSESGSGSKLTKRKRGKSGSSTFRVYTRQCSNFAFPKKIPRPFKDPNFKVFEKSKQKNIKINENLEKINKKLNKFIEKKNKININSDIEENDDEINIDNDYKKRQLIALSKLADKKNLYLKPGKKGLDKHSPKMKKILENMKKTNGLIFIYSNFRNMEGVGVFSLVLEANGYSPFGSDNNLPKYAIYSGTEDEKTKSKILDVFTHETNKRGKRIKVIMVTSAGAEGLDLKNIRQVHIMDPYWHESRIKQVIGRAVRRGSHKALPKKEQNVTIFRYLSIFKDKKINKKLTKKDKLLKNYKSNQSTEEYIYEKSIKNQKIIDELLNLMKSTSIDCLLNKPEIQGDYKCLDFGSAFDKNKLAYSPKFIKDISIKTRKKTVIYTPGLVNKKTRKIYIINSSKKKVYLLGDPSKKDKTNIIKKMKKKKILAKISLNLENNKIFAPNSIRNNPKQIGSFNKKFIFVKS